MPRRISLVVSHCRNSLAWLSKFCSGYPIHDITVFSKCGAHVEEEILPSATKTSVIRPENLGRCDYNYAYLFANMTAVSPQQHDDDDDIVVFVKDDMAGPPWFHFGRWRSLDELISTVSSRSFACAMIPTRARNLAISWWGWSFALYDMSAYADVAVQGNFAKLFHTQVFKLRSSYPDHELKSVLHRRFKSEYASLEEWRETLRLPVPKRMAEVCYGGAFAVTKGNIKRHSHDVWDRLLQSLSRGDNIEEGHFAERTWAALLSDPLGAKEMDSLQVLATSIVTTHWDVLWCNYLGTMMKEVNSCKVYWGYYIVGYVFFQWLSKRCRQRRRETASKLF